MGEKSNYKQTLKIVIIGIIVYCAIQNYALVLHGAGYILNLLFPFLLGGAIAFILNVPMHSIEKLLLPNNKKFDSVRRICAYLLTLILIIGVVALALFVVIPQISSTIKIIVKQVPPAVQAFQQWLYEKSADLPNAQDYIKKINFNWSSISAHAINIIKNAGSTVFSSGISLISGVVGGIANFVIAFIFSIYILFQKEQLAVQAKKTLYAMLPEAKADRTVYIGRISNRVFGNFISGQCIEACILGFMFFITLLVFRIHYSVLIGVVIAFTALIPIFGAFIGLGVGAFLLVMIDPKEALLFIIIFFIIQQIENNLIYPRVVGGSIGLPSLWVLAAVSIGGSLFGMAGILVFIPFCSVCYALFREFVYKKLKEKTVGKEKWEKTVTAEEINKKLEETDPKTSKTGHKMKQQQKNQMKNKKK